VEGWPWLHCPWTSPSQHSMVNRVRAGGRRTKFAQIKSSDYTTESAGEPRPAALSPRHQLQGAEVLLNSGVGVVAMPAMQFDGMVIEEQGVTQHRSHYTDATRASGPGAAWGWVKRLASIGRPGGGRVGPVAVRTGKSPTRPPPPHPCTGYLGRPWIVELFVPPARLEPRMWLCNIDPEASQWHGILCKGSGSGVRVCFDY
jgi:hypothetical protein